MTRVSINLLSRGRRRRLSCRRNLARWALAGAAYGMIVALAWSCATLFAGGEREQLREQLAQGDSDLRRSGDAVDGMRRELASLQRTLDMRRAALDRPDWSTLLRIISTTASPDVSLREVKLDSLPALTPGVGGPRLSLALSGSAPTQLAASQFTIRLQKLGLFDSVELIRSGRDGNAVSFDVLCAAPDEEVRR